MITTAEREKLFSVLLKPVHCQGFDCEARELQKGDRVEVAREEPERAGKPQNAFCSVGMRGTVKRHLMGWVVSVDFNGESVGCVDMNLRKL